MSSVSRAIFCWRSGGRCSRVRMLWQTVGQLDEHDANVIHHGQHHLAQVFGLLFFPRSEIDGADLGDALYDMRYLLAEFLADVDDRD